MLVDCVGHFIYEQNWCEYHICFTRDSLLKDTFDIFAYGEIVLCRCYFDTAAQLRTDIDHEPGAWVVLLHCFAFLYIFKSDMERDFIAIAIIHERRHGDKSSSTHFD